MFLPVKSVAVLGDARAYDYVIALRAVETVDFMTAIWARIPYEVLATISNRIINEVRGFRAWCTTSPASRRRPSSGSRADDIRFMRQAPRSRAAPKQRAKCRSAP